MQNALTSKSGWTPCYSVVFFSMPDGDLQPKLEMTFWRPSRDTQHLFAFQMEEGGGGGTSELKPKLLPAVPQNRIPASSSVTLARALAQSPTPTLTWLVAGRCAAGANIGGPPPLLMARFRWYPEANMAGPLPKGAAHKAKLMVFSIFFWNDWISDGKVGEISANPSASLMVRGQQKMSSIRPSTGQG